jgi:replicative DNA helicase
MSAHTYSTVPIEAKVKAEKYLLGAMLREPYNLAPNIPSLNTIALSHAHNDLHGVFAEVLNQFKSRGGYTTTTVSEATGKQLLEIASSDSDVDLVWAIDNWWKEYAIWAQLTAYAAAKSDDANTMREQVMKMEEKLGLNWSPDKTNAAEDFARWAMDKIDGKEKVFSTHPPMRALRDLVPYFEPGDVWTISGDTGMGKTAFAVNLLSYFTDQKAKGIFFSLEMPATAIYKRLLGVRHGINSRADWRGLETQMSSAVSECANLPVTIIDNAFSISEIENIATSAYYQSEIDYFFIDLLDYVKTGDKDDLQRIFTIYTTLVRVAKRLKCAVFVLAHLNRENKKRGGSKRPVMSDLKGSSTIEQASAGVVFLYRPEYYEITEREDGSTTKGFGEAIVAKHRNGATGTADLSWNEMRGYRDLNPPAFQRIEPDEPPY